MIKFIYFLSTFFKFDKRNHKMQRKDDDDEQKVKNEIKTAIYQIELHFDKGGKCDDKISYEIEHIYGLALSYRQNDLISDINKVVREYQIPTRENQIIENIYYCDCKKRLAKATLTTPCMITFGPFKDFSKQYWRDYGHLLKFDGRATRRLES